MKLSIASDHAGFEYKEAIKEHLLEQGFTVEDFGTDSPESCDYPDFIRLAAQAVAGGQCERGIVLGGSGNGEAMTANKVAGIRCALCWDLESTELSRRHNNANMLSLGQRMISKELALKMVDLWLNTPFDAGRHLKRIEKIENG
ncbi:ribose 5-phosphate isomerase B [Planctomycetota bacterium]